MNNHIQNTLRNNNGVLTLYFTAGYPQLNDTLTILRRVQDAGIQMVEIGIPFSDPLADGPVIQSSGNCALKNGINLELLFGQLEDMRKEIHIPVILMGYFNSIYVYGVEKFVERCAEIGIDGVIFPDLPVEQYIDHYQPTFEAKKLSNIFLVTPQTPEERIRLIDTHSTGFIYVVSTASITGASKHCLSDQVEYFERIKSMKLRNPFQLGFGISDAASFHIACSYAQGAIVGTSFIEHLTKHGISADLIKKFVQTIIRR